MDFAYTDMNQPQVHMCPPFLNPHSHILPHPIPLGGPRAPALGALLHAYKLHWPSTLHMSYTHFSAILWNHPTFTFSQKSVLYICASFAALHVGLSLLSF